MADNPNNISTAVDNGAKNAVNGGLTTSIGTPAEAAKALVTVKAPDADKAKTEPNALVNVNTSNVDKVGVFTTAQSLATFPGATSAVTTIWVVLGNVNPSLGKGNRLIPILLSLAMGLFIYLLSVSRGSTWKEKLSGLGIAVINSFTIAAAALGINSGSP